MLTVRSMSWAREQPRLPVFGPQRIERVAARVNDTHKLAAGCQKAMRFPVQKAKSATFTYKVCFKLFVRNY